MDGITYYEDATLIARASDGSDRLINTSGARVLAHTFVDSEGEAVRNEGLFLRMYVLASQNTGAVGVSLHVAQIVWD